MKPTIISLSSKKLLGIRTRTSLSLNKTRSLWQSFMPRRKEIRNAIGTELYSLQVYDSFYFSNFNPHTEFEKWACVEVKDYDTIPEGMEPFSLPGGLYAVFLYKGSSASGAETFRYIFETWLPSSEYELDNRPHFEVLGEKYRNDNPDSEEEIWIPVKPAQK